MARYCPHIRCFDCDNYGHVAADCPDKIPPSGTPACTAEVTPPVGMIDPHLGIIATTGIPTMIIEIGTGSVIPDPTHTILDTGVTAHHDSHRSCSRSFHRPSCHSSSCHRSSSSYRYCCDTPHHRSSSCRNFFPQMTADPDYTNPTSNIINQHKDLLQVHKLHLGKIRTEDTNRLQLMILPQNTIVQMIRIVTLRTI